MKILALYPTRLPKGAQGSPAGAREDRAEPGDRPRVYLPADVQLGHAHQIDHCLKVLLQITLNDWRQRHNFQDPFKIAECCLLLILRLQPHRRTGQDCMRNIAANNLCRIMAINGFRYSTIGTRGSRNLRRASEESLILYPREAHSKYTPLKQSSGDPQENPTQCIFVPL